MEKFKDSLKFKRNMTIVQILVAIISFILLSFYDSNKIDNQLNFTDSFMDGFRLGIFFAIIIPCVFGVIKYQRLMLDDKKVRNEYIKVNDERTKNIVYNASTAMIRFLLSLMLLSLIVTSFINITVFLTLLIVTFIAGYGFIILKAYYSKKL